MTITVEVDEDTLLAAQKALGTVDDVTTVAQALADAIARDRRRQAIERELGRAEQYSTLDRAAIWK